MAEQGARTAIEADGYKAVRSLRRSVDGGWSARALRGTIDVGLSVEFEGRRFSELTRGQVLLTRWEDVGQPANPPLLRELIHENPREKSK